MPPKYIPTDGVLKAAVRSFVARVGEAPPGQVEIRSGEEEEEISTPSEPESKDPGLDNGAVF